MKYFNSALLIIFLSVFNLSISYAQCENNVNTDYNDTPTNEALPTNPPQPNYGEQFLNEFDWVPRSVNQTVAKYQTINMNSNILDAGEIQNIYSNQQHPFYSYLYNDLEPNPMNGWELISVNLGYFPNGEIQSPTSAHTDFPYLILYNKYRSILRVFGVLGAGFSDFGTSVDGVVVKLFIEKNDADLNYNGLLRRAEGTDKTLDQETDFYKMASVTKHQDQKGKWFSADFQIAYDPCVCYYDSRLRLKFDFIETAYNFDAQINSISVEEDLVTSTTDLVDSDFLNNFNYNETGVREYDASNGYLIYDAIDSLLVNYERELTAYEDSIEAIGEHNKQVTRRKWIVKAGRFVLQAGTFALTGGASGGGTTAATLENILPQVAPDLLKNENELSELVLSELQKLLGKGSEMLISEWVGEKVEPEDYPDQPMHPTATFTQSTMRGTIQRTIDNYAGPQLRTPGTYGGSFTGSTEPITTPHEYPVYNEALGVFALLKKPKIEIAKFIKGASCEISEYPVYSEPGSVPGSEVYYHESSSEYEHVTQIKLLEKLDYLFNPVLDIKDYSIQTSFLVNGQVNNLNSDYVATNSEESVNIESISFNADELDTLEHQDTVEFNSIYTPIDALNNFVFSAGVKKTTPDMITLNDYCEQFEIDISKLKNNLSAEQNQALKIEDIYLKLLINVTYEGEKSDGSPHEYTYMFTYKIDKSDISYDYNNPLHPNLPGSSGDITQYPENLFLDGENFDGSPVDGCELNGNVYTCKAWNDVELSGNFTVTNNYDVFIEGGNEVRVLPDAVTPPEMVWQIEPVLDYSDPMPPVGETYVSEFCQNEDEYKARSGTKMLQKDSTSESRTPEQGETFAFVLYPNPTSGTTTARIELESAAVSELYITDINGRKLTSAFKDQPLRAGVNEYQIPTESLNSGVYLVHLFIDGKHHVKRLVKQ